MVNDKTARRRRTIPKRVAASVELASDRRCCMCEQPGHHIHHLNGDPSDNRFENLALVCFVHHDEASRTGGLSRKLARETIAGYREYWYAIVAAKRAARLPAPRRQDEHEIVLAALARHDVRKLGFKIDRIRANAWPPGLEDILRDLSAFAATGDVAVRFDVVEVLSGLAARTRFGMLHSVAHGVYAAVSSALPLRSLESPCGEIPKDDVPLLEAGTELGRNVAYDAARYLSDLVVLDIGASILWDILRYAHLNKHRGLLQTASDAFDSAARAAEACVKGRFDDGLRWLEFKRKDALALENPPNMPADLAQRVFAREP